MDFALASGFHAAQALLAARAAGDTTAVGLAGYERRLRDSFVLRDLETFKGAPQLIENRRLFTQYPDAVARMLEDVFRVGPQGGQSLLSRRPARRAARVPQARHAQGPLVAAQVVVRGRWVKR